MDAGVQAYDPGRSPALEPSRGAVPARLEHARDLGGAGLLAFIAGAGYALWRRQRHRIDLRGRVALVSGATRGLGLEIARQLLQQGAHVSICARDPDELDEAQLELAPEGGELLAVACDVGDQDQVELWIESAAKHFGRIDVLVNNAGEMLVAPLETLEVEDFEQAFDVHFWGPLYTILAALEHLKRSDAARIVNIVSIGGRVAVPRMLPYTTSKFALAGLSEGLRSELSGKGVRVTTVVPGPMRTGSHVHASFRGEHEYDWFRRMATLPLASVGVRRAARRIVSAARRGQAELILTPTAILSSLFHGAAPGLASGVSGFVDRHLLPAPEPGAEERQGSELEPRRDG